MTEATYSPREEFFGVREDERVGVFIDGPNFFSAAKAIGLRVDYAKLIEYLDEMSNFVRANYYTALSTDQETHDPIRPMIDFLEYNGYNLVTKPVKTFEDSEGRRRFKGNMDIEIAIDVLEAAEHLNHVIMFTGDGDFRALVDRVQRKGVRVTVVSTMNKDGTGGPMIADELRRKADSFVELATLKPLLTKAERTDR
jgi:uncharacterized LabA/DUF88 family protein